MLRRSNTVLNRASGREMEHPLILRKRKQLEQKPTVDGRCQSNTYIAMRCISLFDRVDRIGEFVETPPIFSTFRPLDVTIDSIANVTCPVYEQV